MHIPLFVLSFSFLQVLYTFDLLNLHFIICIYYIPLYPFTYVSVFLCIFLYAFLCSTFPVFMRSDIVQFKVQLTKNCSSHLPTLRQI